MKDASEVFSDDKYANEIKEIEAIGLPNKDVTDQPKEVTLNNGDIVIYKNKRYKFTESKKMDINHRYIPHLVVMGPA